MPPAQSQLHVKFSSRVNPIIPLVMPCVCGQKNPLCLCLLSNTTCVLVTNKMPANNQKKLGILSCKSQTTINNYLISVLTGWSVNQSLYTFHKWLCDLAVTHWKFAPTCAFSAKQMVILFKTRAFTEQHVCSQNMYLLWSGSRLDFQFGNGLFIRLVSRQSFDETKCVRHIFLAFSIWVKYLVINSNTALSRLVPFKTSHSAAQSLIHHQSVVSIHTEK